MITELLILDLDGVLCDSVGLIWDAICNLFFEHPSFGFERKDIPKFTNFLESFRLPGDEWFASHGFDFPSAVIRETLRHAPDKAKMFPAVPLMFNTIRRSHPKLPIIVISAGDQLRIERQLTAGGVRNYFEAVFGETPDKAEAIFSFCSLWGICPAKTVYVGDMPQDMRDSREAGVIPIGFTDDQPIMERVLTKAGAQHCVPNHQKLGDLLIELAQI